MKKMPCCLQASPALATFLSNALVRAGQDEVVSGVMREGEETTTGTEVVEVGVVTTEAVVGVDKEEVTTGAAAFCTTLDA